ncbi:MAG TPA: FAD-dependent oxidoreductase [Nitrospiraceae bacterium]|nr:FAD-dependent oxidoreductase [Nitrospiraceae bacterium]
MVPLPILVTTASPQSVVIFGGGPAGLTTAYRLTRHGYRVTVVEKRSLLGGARTHKLPGDNPEPFTILGCHRATHTLLHSLHSSPQQPESIAIPLEFRLPDGSLVHYPRTAFPSPLHTWVNLLRFAGIPWKERWRLASWVEQLWEGDAELPADLEQRTADDWLASIGQSVQTRSLIWNPLARWLTGNDLVTMSADAFVRSMKPVFLSTHPDSRISVVQDSLLTCFVRPITEVLRQGNATILPNTEATQLRYEQDRISGVLLRDGSLLQADWYVTALPPQQLTPLLPERWLTRYAYFQQLAELRSIDRTILHLHAMQACATPRLVLLSDTSFHSVLVTATVPNRTDFSLITTDSQFAQTQPNSPRDVAIPDLLRSWDSSWLKIRSRQPSIERFPTLSSHSSLEPNYIDLSNAVRLQTCS